MAHAPPPLPRPSVYPFVRPSILLSELTMETVALALPKFTFRGSYSLNTPLQSLGMNDAFSDSTANFSRMAADADLYISSVIHKTYINVWEVGR